MAGIIQRGIAISVGNLQSTRWSLTTFKTAPHTRIPGSNRGSLQDFISCRLSDELVDIVQKRFFIVGGKEIDPEKW